MLAVGGGAMPVLATLRGVGGLFWSPLGLRLPAEGVAGVGELPPYFSSNCCVELYLVASLSLVIAASRCLVRSLRWLCEFTRR